MTEATAAGAPRRVGRAATARERARQEVLAELLAAARARIAQEGGATLSLRAVARDLGMASSAVYRYVASRDEMLTLLILESYRSVAEAARTADHRAAAAADASGGARWLAVCRAVRAWAREHPHEYELIFGTPIPGYRAPSTTIEAAVQLWAVIAGIVQDAGAAGELRLPERVFAIEGIFAPVVTAVAGEPVPGRPDLVGRTMVLFTSLVGAITSELFGHLADLTDQPDLLFDVLVATAAEGVGLLLPVPTTHPG